jgi:hypothetical protein
LIDFAHSEQHIRNLLNWKDKKDENLQGISMVGGTKWHTVAKAFTLDDMSLEEKEKVFDVMQNFDKSDNLKKFRHYCDGLRST